MPQTHPRPRILFVCLGNICRSPLAEAALRSEAARTGCDLEVDSAGTGSWHIGHPPDQRAQATAQRHGIDIAVYRVRQVNADDFRNFSHIFALDTANLADLRRMAPADATAQLMLLLDLVEGRAGEGVADPYHGDAADFETTWSDVDLGAKALVQLLSR